MSTIPLGQGAGFRFLWGGGGVGGVDGGWGRVSDDLQCSSTAVKAPCEGVCLFDSLHKPYTTGCLR